MRSSDDALRARTGEFKKQVAEGASLDDILVPAFATVREAAKRLRQRVTSQRGDAAFIGDDSSRDKGQAVFAQEIKKYELKHPKLPPPCEGKQ